MGIDHNRSLKSLTFLFNILFDLSCATRYALSMNNTTKCKCSKKDRHEGHKITCSKSGVKWSTPKPMFQVYFTNFDYSRDFDTFEQAADAMKAANFESTMFVRDAHHSLAATYSPINGLDCKPVYACGSFDRGKYKSQVKGW